MVIPANTKTSKAETFSGEKNMHKATKTFTSNAA